MTQQFKFRQIPAGNPLANILVVAVGAIVIAVSFVLGIVAIVALVAALMVMAAIIGVRVWWLNRRFRRSGKTGAEASRTRSSGPSVIEGEFREIGSRNDGEPENRP